MWPKHPANIVIDSATYLLMISSPEKRTSTLIPRPFQEQLSENCQLMDLCDLGTHRKCLLCVFWIVYREYKINGTMITVSIH